MLKPISTGLTLLLAAGSLFAQVPSDDWELEESYRGAMLLLHSRVNYSYDLAWQFDWERRQFAGNAARITTGSVTSDDLLTDIDIGINQSLNDQWRFQGSFRRNGYLERSIQDEQLLLGFERSLFDNSALYVTVNPEFDKESIDVAAGYTFYKDDRQQYLRMGVLIEDVNYETKNDLGGETEQSPIALQWFARWAIGKGWFVYSEGEVGSGYERLFTDATLSPDVSRHDRRENMAELRFSKSAEDGTLWSAWIDWYDFDESRAFRQPGFDYDYRNTQFAVSAEHVRVWNERHRWRFLLNYVDISAESRGFRQHDFERNDLLGGAFYEYLWPNSGLTVAYALGLPEFSYRSVDPAEDYELDEYRDKLILGYRYRFSQDAEIRLSLSHEVSVQGFGGGSVQFQMFF